jgi:hypothetical protein
MKGVCVIINRFIDHCGEILKLHVHEVHSSIHYCIFLNDKFMRSLSSTRDFFYLTSEKSEYPDFHFQKLK